MRRSNLPTALAVGLLILLFMWAFLSTSGTTYTDPAHRFTIELPAGSAPQIFPAADGSHEILAIRRGTEYVQITISTWAGDDVLTKAALVSNSLLDPNVIPSATFFAGKSGVAFAASNVGDFNIWLASNGYLYRFVELGTSSDLLQTVISRWRFD